MANASLTSLAFSWTSADMFRRSGGAMHDRPDHGGTMASGFLTSLVFSWTSADMFRRSFGLNPDLNPRPQKNRRPDEPDGGG
jgi:hypothetical protein